MTASPAKAAEPADIFETAALVDRSSAPALARGSDRIVDLAHLAYMTGDDHRLAQEVLRLFVMQCDILLARMRGESAAVVGVLAHTLTGSARGIGAWAAAEAAEEVERIAAGDGDLTGAVERLAAATAQTRAAIAEMTRHT
jgi:hypothetical protein